MKISLIIMFLMLILTSSCTTVPDCRNEVPVADNYNVFLIEDSSEYRILIFRGFPFVSPENNAEVYNSICLSILDQSKDVQDQSEPLKFINDNSVLLGAGFQIDKKLVPNGLNDKTFKFYLRKKDNCYYFVKDYDEMFVESQNINESTALKLLPYYTNLADGEVQFGLLATRVYKKENEYIPSSEDLRVEVKTQSGKTIWSSNYGMNFLQVISEVEPVEVDDAQLYSIKWDGKSRSGKPFKSGTYIVELTIPAQPDNYTVTMKYERIYDDD